MCLCVHIEYRNLVFRIFTQNQSGSRRKLLSAGLNSNGGIIKRIWYKEAVTGNCIKEARKFITGGKDFAVERTGMRPDLAVTEVALGHHSPYPAQRDVLVTVPAWCWEGPDLASSCSLQGTDGGWDPLQVWANNLFEPSSISVGFLGLLPLHRRGMQVGHAQVGGDYWLHPCLGAGQGVNIIACVHMWYEDFGTSYRRIFRMLVLLL